jgi:hypothetical protein
VNSIALSPRLTSTWRNRSGSPTIAVGTAESTIVSSRICLASLFGISVMRTSSIVERILKTSESRRVFSASILETSSRSFTVAKRPDADRRRANKYSCCSAAEVVFSTNSVIPRTPWIGVRSSWLTLAKNRVLASLAASAASLANSTSRNRSVTTPSYPDPLTDIRWNAQLRRVDVTVSGGRMTSG